MYGHVLFRMDTINNFNDEKTHFVRSVTCFYDGLNANFVMFF